MIKIQDVVAQLVHKDEEALSALSRGFMNYSAYAKAIHAEVEALTKKEVKVSGVVVALTRVKEHVGKAHPMVADVPIKQIVTRLPLSEYAFERNQSILNKLPALYETVDSAQDDFLITVQATSEISLTCSDRIKDKILNIVNAKPVLEVSGLASIGLAFDPKYYPQPNITFSMLRKIARRHIPLAQKVSSRRELILTFKQEHLADIIELFRPTA